MKLFLSVPFTSQTNSEGHVIESYRVAIEDLLATLRDRGHQVFCSLEHAHWKLGGMTSPQEEFTADLQEIDKADKIVVLLEERVSAGVQVENGYAYAKGKPLEIYQIGKTAWSNLAFGSLEGNSITPVEGILDFVDQAKITNT